ncbi:lamin tail domain-containing protein [Pseudotenacibaculum haliotis]|uniref:Lamin tail domain-containing protein n=1 Tax=Pseudotenacibaculum haliotis TaxID=1862138 RepID=A0ABW5LQ81_9FLAO
MKKILLLSFLLAIPSVAFSFQDGDILIDHNTFKGTLTNSGQSFTATKTTKWTALSFEFSEAFTGTLNIYAGHVATGTPIHTQPFNVAAGQQEIVLTTPIDIVQGQQYTAVTDVTCAYYPFATYGGGSAWTVTLSFPGDLWMKVTTLDTTPPVFENSTPSSASITTTGFTLNTDIHEAGTIYYVVLADGATAPTTAEVKAGTASGGGSAVTSGNAAVTSGGFTNAFSVTGLTSNTAYDVYVVAQDDSDTPNIQATPIKVDVTTLSGDFIVVESGGSTSTNENGTTDTFTVTLNSQPNSNVVINLSSGDVTEGTIDKSTLTFTNANWNIAQTVTVTGLDDVITDGSPSYNVTLSIDAALTDDAFDGAANQTVSVTNFDNEITTASAGSDQNVCGGATFLGGNSPNGGESGTWSIISGAGGSFGAMNSPTSSFSGTINTAYTLRWTIGNGGVSESTDDVVITFFDNPTAAAAGPDQNNIHGTATLAGNTISGFNETGIWTQIAGPGVITFGDVNSPTSTATASLSGSYTLHWTSSNGVCPISSDDVVIEYTCVTPSAAATTAVFGSKSSSTLSLASFTAPAGGADGYVIKMNTTNSFTAPTDGALPSANLAYSGSGEQVVYAGTSASPNITVTGLSESTTYYFQVYAYNDCSGTNTFEATGLSASNATTGPYSTGANGTQISSADGTAIANGTDTETVTVQLKDVNGNNVSQSNIGIALVLTGNAVFNSGPGLNLLSSQIVTGTTDANGVLTVTINNTTAESVNVTGTVAGNDITNGSPATVVFTPGPVSNGANGTQISSADGTAIANGTDTETITVQLRDVNGNAISQSGIAIALNVSGSAVFNAGSGLTLSNSNQTVTGTTNASGVFTATIDNTIAESVNVTGTIAGNAIANGSPAAVVFETQPIDLLITEVAITPTAGEFVEIYNPTSSTIDLTNVYITDATFASGGIYYYNIVTGANYGGGGFGDFHARFPNGATIAAGEYQTISISGSDEFFSTYGVNPTYELYEDGGASDAIPDMLEAVAGSINGQGGLTNSGEFVVLYTWDGSSDLVKDLDYFVWGDKVEGVDKTGISIDGPDGGTSTSSYQNDTPIASQIAVSSGSHSSDTSWQRIDLTESRETKTGGNGDLGHDETSENLSTAFTAISPTPNRATPLMFQNNTPSSSNITTGGFTLETDVDRAGTIYYVVVADNATQPTEAEIKAGTGSGGTGEIASGGQTVNSGDFTHNFNVTGLSASTSYDIYVVAEDALGSFSSISKVDVTTNDPANIVITEIMYNAAEPGADITEYIELYNAGSSTVDLTGYSFSEGIIHTFTSGSIAPGAYFVITVNMTELDNRYGAGTADAQWTSGGLSNSGEDIILIDNGGTQIDIVDYDDNAPWPTEADGDGPSIRLCDPTADNNLGSNWSASTESIGVMINGFEVKGTPGTAAVCDVTPPTISTTNPLDDAVSVNDAQNITISFNENIAFGTGNIQVIDVTDGSNSFTIDVTSPGSQASVFDDVLTINPSNLLDRNSNYAIQIDNTAIRDIAGNSFAGIADNTTLNFMTVPNLEVTFTVNHPSSATATDGSIAANATGGVPPYTYVWSNGQTTQTINNLAPAQYNLVSVTDANGFVAVGPIITLIPPVEISFTNSNSSGSESVSSVNIPVELSTTSNVTITVDYTVTGTATGGSDYTLADGTLTFNPLSTGDNLTIANIVDDAIVETNETVIITLSNPTNATLGTNAVYTYTIDNNDTTEVTIVGDVQVDEDAGNAILTAMLSNPVQGGFFIHVTTSNGTAVAPGDFTASNDEANTDFSGNAGETQQLFIPIIDDSEGEANETFTVTLSSVSGTTLGSSITTTDSATVTIVDNDAPVVSSVSVPADGLYGIGSDLDFTVSFTDAVTITGTPRIPMTIGSTTVNAELNGTVTNSSTASFRYTITEGELDTDGIVVGTTIDLNGGSIVGTSSTIDAVLTLNSVGATGNINVDGIRPTVTITTDAADPTNVAYTATFTFSEDVTGFEVGDITVGNGTANDFNAMSATVYTATITPTADGAVTVDVAANVAEDAATNGNDAAVQYSVLYDATNPTATLTTTAPNPVNTPFTIDITFDEDVFGFEMADLNITNGTPSDFAAANATMYSVLITPTGAGDVVVDIPAGVTEDLATNGNNAASFTIEYDNIPPTPPTITHISEYTCAGNVTMTSDNTLKISGTAERESTVEVFIESISVGTTITDDNGFFTFDHSGTTLADGTYNITARATDIAGNTGDISAAFTITINTVDSDSDGIADFCDDDDDGNGVDDVDEDCDGDGIIDSQDTDNSACTSGILQTRSYGFSPNGDGVNDGWTIENITAFPNNTVSVFSRSGKLVFKKKGYRNDWTGISNQTNSSGNNSKLPVGPYIYVIDLGDGSKPVRGWLYINY